MRRGQCIRLGFNKHLRLIARIVRMMWTIEESNAIIHLENIGFSAREARTVAAMASGRYVRERDKLIDILCGHIGLENRAATEQTVESLMARGCLTETKTGNYLLISLNNQFIASVEHEEAAAAIKALDALERVHRPRARMLGNMTDPTQLLAFRGAINEAESIIRLPFFSSSADIEAIPNLRERAEAGVEVRILLASPTVMGQLRGRAHVSRSKAAIKSWVQVTRGWPNCIVRVARSLSDIELGSSMSVDGRLLRLDLHEPLIERSLAGQMLEVNAGGANLVRAFDRSFDSSWRTARSTAMFERMRRSSWSVRWTVATTLALIALLTVTNSNFHDVIAGVLATCIIGAVGENYKRIAEATRRAREGRR